MAGKVENIETFLKQLPRLNEKMSGNVFYRGQSDATYKLTPSVFREGMRINEQKIYTEIMTECAHEFDECKLHNEILSKMQHYGVPTRLLDVTTNALVALYFACDGDRESNKDGAVYVLRTESDQLKQYDSDSISILSCIPKFNQYDQAQLRDYAREAIQEFTDQDLMIKKFNDHGCVKRLLHEIKKEKPGFENAINPKDLLSNYFFIPRKINARIIRQSGAFILFGLDKAEIKVENLADDWGTYKIIIENTKKETIINQLACFGISKATLHPELYKVAEYIKTKYRSGGM